MPNHARTPGATNPAVSQRNIASTICLRGWTATIRPPAGYTTSLKEQQLAAGYSYRGDRSTGDYEEDHLISLELGGSPTSPRNLWPEPYHAHHGAYAKDGIEDKLHALVCAHRLPLATAQHAIAADWWRAYGTYLSWQVPAAPAHRSTVAPRPTQPSTPPPVGAPGGGATAQCNDGTYSHAAHHQGACSHHGGVRIFYN